MARPPRRFEPCSGAGCLCPRSIVREEGPRVMAVGLTLTHSDMSLKKADRLVSPSLKSRPVDYASPPRYAHYWLFRLNGRAAPMRYDSNPLAPETRIHDLDLTFSGRPA